MAEIKGMPFNSKIVNETPDMLYSADDLTEYAGMLFSDGINSRINNNAVISAGVGLVINISPVDAMVNGTRCYLPANMTETLQQGGARDRIDCVAIRRSYSERKAELVVIKGAEGEGRPSLTYENMGTAEIAIGWVTVPAGSITITGENIENTPPVMDYNGPKAPIGTVIWSYSDRAKDHPGFLPLWTGELYLNGSSVYRNFYSWVKSLPKICTSLSDYQDKIAKTNRCSFYVVDEKPGSLRLPKLSGFIKCATDGIAQEEAGLPNILGSIPINTGETQGTGSLYYEKKAAGGSFASSSQMPLVLFDASRSSKIYGNSNTVTPENTALFPWVCAFNASVPASIAQASEFIGAVSGKANQDLANVTSFGKTLSAGWCMPDYTAGIAVPPNQNYVAPCAGVIICYTLSNYGGDSAEVLRINDKVVGVGLNSYSGKRACLSAWASAGDTIHFTLPAGTGWVNTFYPMKGAI